MNCEIQWTPIVGSIVTSCVLIAGWFYVSRDNDARERRKELRGQLDLAAKDIEAVVSLASKIFSKSGSDFEGAVEREKLLTHLKLAGARIFVIGKEYPTFSVSKQVIALRQAATDSESGFDDPTRAAGSTPASIRVAQAACSLTIALELQYSSLFSRG